MLDFWSLVTRGQKHQALSYVAEGQDHFLNWNWPPVQSYRMQKLELEQQGSQEVGGHDADRRSTPQLPGNGQLVGPATMGLAGGDLDDPGPSIEFGGCFREQAPQTGSGFQSGPGRRPANSSGNSGFESGGFNSAKSRREKRVGTRSPTTTKAESRSACA